VADLDQLTTEVFNGHTASEAYEPVFDFIEWKGTSICREEWKTIRQALEKMPPKRHCRTVKMRGLSTSSWRSGKGR